ncbi:N-acetylglucosaminyltransferase [Pseudomaricurvus alkylphenolicus]|uniref:N-acetylglucosaminyltransferase n=1 Tax=Pseudomaricurvus alkylphenolicus TaxID=1306991 RepID=UPI001420CEB1|nr:N-acetylglucosaminyltransferase [Pseudomaricurvus alkylphenolicus]NIB39040.1 N-acetylglucosaminyltransferase [Pseudomaricurvus alkylphenolicus]
MSGEKRGIGVRLVSLGLVLALAGCVQQQATREPVSSKQAPNAKSQKQVSPVRRLLAEAEAALSDDRLMTPANNNAYDRYQAVLLLQPNHPQARSGLQQILIRYLQLARASLGRSQLKQAEIYADRARRIDRHNPLLQEFDQQLQRQRQHLEAAGEGEFPLDAGAVSRRSDELLPVLAEIVGRLRRTDETVLIVARTDADGRWLYKQMKKAAAGYRIRGDIKTGPQPKILVLAPINSL